MTRYPTRRPPYDVAVKRDEKKEKRKQLLAEIRKKRAQALRGLYKR